MREDGCHVLVTAVFTQPPIVTGGECRWQVSCVWREADEDEDRWLRTVWYAIEQVEQWPLADNQEEARDAILNA